MYTDTFCVTGIYDDGYDEFGGGFGGGYGGRGMGRRGMMGGSSRVLQLAISVFTGS